MKPRKPRKPNLTFSSVLEEQDNPDKKSKKPDAKSDSLKLYGSIKPMLEFLSPLQLTDSGLSKRQSWLGELAGFCFEVETTLLDKLTSAETVERMKRAWDSVKEGMECEIEIEARIVCVVNKTTVSLPDRASTRLTEHLKNRVPTLASSARQEKFDSYSYTKVKEEKSFNNHPNSVRFRYECDASGKPKQKPPLTIQKTKLLTWDVPIYKSSHGWSGLRFAFSAETTIPIQHIAKILGTGWEYNETSIDSVTRHIVRDVYFSESQLPFCSLQMSSVSTTGVEKGRLLPVKQSQEIELEFNHIDSTTGKCQKLVGNPNQIVPTLFQPTSSRDFRNWLVTCFTIHQICFSG